MYLKLYTSKLTDGISFRQTYVLRFMLCEMLVTKKWSQVKDFCGINKPVALCFLIHTFSTKNIVAG